MFLTNKQTIELADRIKPSKPIAPTNPVKLTLTRSFMTAACNPLRQREACMFALQLCNSLNILSDSDKMRKTPASSKSVSELRSIAYQRAYEFAESPSRSTYWAWLRASNHIDSGILRVSDRYHDTQPTLSMTVPALDPLTKPVSRAPVGALDWQTKPAIGVNPALVYELEVHARRLNYKKSPKLSDSDKKVVRKPKQPKQTPKLGLKTDAMPAIKWHELFPKLNLNPRDE